LFLCLRTSFSISLELDERLWGKRWAREREAGAVSSIK